MSTTEKTKKISQSLSHSRNFRMQFNSIVLKFNSKERKSNKNCIPKPQKKDLQITVPNSDSQGLKIDQEPSSKRKLNKMLKN